jgi:hypothetical protein
MKTEGFKKGFMKTVSSSNVGANSRHIERKVFKMKELRTRGIVKVVLIPTEENASDLLTKGPRPCTGQVSG